MDPNIISQLIADPQFKSLQSYLKLARDSLEKQPLISYWALYYVLDQGIRVPKQDDSFKKALGNIMGCLEKEKTARKSDPLFANEQEGKKFILDYANQLLVRAEGENELGVSAAVCIKLYLACANVSQLLTLFGDKSDENAQRIKYSKWKAVSIAKEVKEGGWPRASTGGGGGGGGQPDGNNADEGENHVKDEYSPPPPPDNQGFEFPPSATNFEPDTSRQQPPEPKPRASISSAPPALIDPEPDFANLNLSDSDSRKAELLCESALYAIKGGDIMAAVQQLKQTLQVLQKCARQSNY